MGRVHKTSRKELSPLERAKIWGRYDNGETRNSLAVRFNRSYSTIASFIERCEKQDKPDFKSKPRYIPPKKTSDRDDRALLRHVNNNPKDSLKVLCTPSKSGHKLYTTTIRQILKSYGKAKRKPRRKPYLCPKNKKKRFR